MLKRLLIWLRAVLVGQALTQSIARNAEAADKLDQAVREVLNP